MKLAYFRINYYAGLLAWYPNAKKPKADGNGKTSATDKSVEIKENAELGSAEKTEIPDVTEPETQT